MNSVSFTIRPDGTIESLDDLSFGPTTVRRASHIEPTSAVLRWAFHALRYVFGESGVVSDWTRVWSVEWRVNMGPSGGPTFGAFRKRDEALACERQWLEINCGF